MYLSGIFILFAQEENAQDSINKGFSLGKLKMENPQSIVSKYTYDPVSDRYIYTESVADFDVRYPIILTPEQYYDLILKEGMKDYFKDKSDAIEGKKEGSEEAQKNLLPNFYVNSNFFETLFGSNTIEVIPQGSIAMDLGIRHQKNDNPSLSPRNRNNLSFDFDQRISLSMLGKVGTRLAITANYDTEATFDFQNLIKLEYTPTEDDIIQKIEVGNISMPLNSSLIKGAQSLFGVKTQFQFGKTTVTGVFSEQRSQSRNVVSQGGGTINEFEILALDYDEDRHFFLSHFFRNQYDTALEKYPFINSQIQITRIEVWVTNRVQRTQNVRNIVGIQDLGEALPENTRLNTNAPAGFFNSVNDRPRNEANDFNPFEIGGSSVLTELIRDVATVETGFGPLNGIVNQGFDYAFLENARKLEEGRDYTLSTQLGYISLNQRLSSDEILGVAYQYTYRGEVYQVGEFANDGVNATEFESTNGVVTAVNNQSLIVKLLKSNILNVSDPIWDLMMKNIYSTGAFQLLQEDFKLNILYTDPSPINYITPVDEATWPAGLEEQILLDVFNFDRLNIYNDPQNGGDGFFDYMPGITIDQQNGNIIFTKVEPFGEHLYNLLGTEGFYNDDSNYQSSNLNQLKYVFRNMYKSTKADAYEDSDKNKFQLKGRYKSEGGSGIPLGAFNVPRGSVRVTAGGRILQEGIDYTVNYQAGTVQILDEGLKASNVPINVSVENNAVFGQQTRRFMGVNVEHQFNDNFMLGTTLLNLKERPLTQKANFGTEPVNNTIFGFNGNFSTEVPFLTRLVNKLPNIDTDVPSNLSVRGEFAYLIPGSPKSADFDGETTAYLDDFEGAQSLIDIRSALAWTLASTPLTTAFGDETGLTNGYERAKLAWYSIDPIFYTSQRPGGINDNDVSLNSTRRIFIDELFPEIDIPQGQPTIQNTFDLAYYPNIKGPYNNRSDDQFTANTEDNWGGIMRSLTSTNFEQSNVEYIQFWVLDPYFQDSELPSSGGELVFNLGNISEDILRDGRKQFENGLPGTSAGTIVTPTEWGEVPSGQALVYAFDADNANREAQDIGFDGLSDAREASIYSNNSSSDPALDNYEFYLNREGGIVERYLNYNNPDGNSPVSVSNTDRGSTTIPDVEDVDRDLTMNTVNSYYEYRIPIRPNIQITDRFVTDIRRVTTLPLPNGDTYDVRWIQFKIPINPSSYAASDPLFSAVNGITDLRSISFMRMFLTGFDENVVLRFGTLDLVRGDWRTYSRALSDNVDLNLSENASLDVSAVNIQENESRIPIAYVLPRGVRREQLNNNNTIININEQSLSFSVCDLEPQDSRAVFKNLNIDLRQYKKLKMFIHAEAQNNPDRLQDGDLIGFIRLGTDFNDNYYQIEVPLSPTQYTPGENNKLSSEEVWPEENDIDVSLDILSRIKAQVLENPNLNPSLANFFDEGINTIDEFARLQVSTTNKEYRYGIKGNPSLGNIRAIMVGVKNADEDDNVCAEVWFNELRLSELDNKGGWASIATVDANFADFANVSATGRISTIGFGGLEDLPNERSREKAIQYNLNTNLNLGQLLPKKWGIQLPLNYTVSEELITPEFDPLYQDLKLQDRLDAAPNDEQREQTLNRAEDYTKRTSINFIGIRKNRAPEKKPHFYDVENVTLNYAYNQLSHRDFEVEQLTDQNVRTGFTYSYNFEPKEVEPFKKNDSIFKSAYWQWLKDLNLNLLPASISMNSNITRSLNKQSFRQISDPSVNSDNFIVPELQQRNYLFDWQYAINYNLTKSLSFNFTASNNSIVKNYFIEDENGNTIINKDLTLWNGFLDTGEPNRHTQQLQVNYELPFSKIPFLSFITSTYSYTGDFDWQRGSDVLNEIVDEALGTQGNQLNTIQNASTHDLNGSLSMDKLYSYLGFVRKGKKKRGTGARRPNPTMQSRRPVEGEKEKTSSAKNKTSTKIYNTAVDLVGMIKRINVSYSKNSGKVLPGYTRSIGFIGTLKPSWGFVFGDQSDIRFEAARKGWLTTFPDFNQQFMRRDATQLNISANAEPVKGLTIDLIADRQYSDSYTENFNVADMPGNELEYIAQTPNLFGDFSISTIMIKTAFSKSDDQNSKTFDEFRKNRLAIAQRLAGEPINPNGAFPDGYGPTNQSVLLPAFIAAYTGKDANKISLKAFRDIPIPNWTIKYSGLMNFKWFQKKFRRFSLTHGYRSSYSINSFRSNLDFGVGSQFDQSDNFKNETLYTNVTLVEQFNPLIKLDFEMKNSINIQAEIRKDRALSMSFDNNLLTEVNGKEYILGLGYRVKDVRFTTRLGGSKKTLKGDVNFKADLSLRDNITVIRNLDIDTNQITSGQNLWSIKFTTDYALNKNLTALFFYDHTFSKFKVSTAFPQTTIRSGITLRYNFGN